MWHKTQRTENLIGGRKYLPDPAPPAHAPAGDGSKAFTIWGCIVDGTLAARGLKEHLHRVLWFLLTYNFC